MRMIVRDDGSVTFPGIDHSNGSKPLTIVKRIYDPATRKPAIVVVRHPGGKCWAGVNMDRSNVPVSFMVLRLVAREGKGEWRVEEIVEIAPRQLVEALPRIDLQDLVE